MKAAQFYGKRDIRVNDVPKPSPLPHEALVAIEWSGICGSDLHEYLVGPLVIPTKDNPHPATHESLPVTLGHEFCGRIVSAPEGSPLSPGQPVSVDPRIFCRSCTRCSESHTNACRTWGFKGLSGSGGGFSEAVAVDAKLCYPLPEHVDLRLAALIEPLAVAWHAIAIIGDVDWTTTSALIVGGGPVGIAHIHCLRAKGCRRIFVSEPTATRAAQNREFADEVFNPIEENVGDRVRELTGGEGVDIVFDCAGIQKGLEAGMDALRHHGTYMNVAGWETPMNVPVGLFMLKEIHMRASLSYTDQHYKETVDAFVAGKFKGVEKMVTSRIHIDDISTKGFDELVANKDKHIKILVTAHKDKL
ncbi:threonine dehydrogenase [Aaosphaeria arxii CBS 175.79]|uniref:Threonine dehydrogenase n=1 Tax=Aaosphaeria arxii CBS 175.79 TaxID=1450172 RepID=A0A6A5X9Z0_9PLEO|nr:threonine dehydrogenase [Aaosphaeria arxii CBS 175.79]KAF2009676.1 threonine dehydrogenase [Aaosphaeria arxii CBS 175.79]